MLGLRDLEDPGEAETITPMDRGTLVHAILERFFSQRLGRHADAVWTHDDYEELLAVADEFEGIFRARGLTGRPLLWQAEWAALRRHLRKILDADGRDPRLVGVAPAEVELAFGFEGEPTPPVQIDLGDGRKLNFGGRVDRIDRSADGRKLVVLDYKTGSAYHYAVIDADHEEHDIVARGELLQLPIYALAARAQFPDAEEAEAYYWFVGQRGAIQMKGGPVDEAAAERFESVVRTIVDGIEEGLVPGAAGRRRVAPGHRADPCELHVLRVRWPLFVATRRAVVDHPQPRRAARLRGTERGVTLSLRSFAIAHSGGGWRLADADAAEGPGGHRGRR